jgi:hypothetical protein
MKLDLRFVTFDSCHSTLLNDNIQHFRKAKNNFCGGIEKGFVIFPIGTCQKELNTTDKQTRKCAKNV